MNFDISVVIKNCIFFDRTFFSSPFFRFSIICFSMLLISAYFEVDALFICIDSGLLRCIQFFYFVFIFLSWFSLVLYLVVLPLFLFPSISFEFYDNLIVIFFSPASRNNTNQNPYFVVLMIFFEFYYNLIIKIFASGRPELH